MSYDLAFAGKTSDAVQLRLYDENQHGSDN